MKETAELLSVTENNFNNFLRFFNIRSFSDFIIRTQSQSFYAHKAILSARSEFFRDYFRIKTDEEEIEFLSLLNEEERLQEEVLKGEDVILWCILQFIYADKIYMPKNDYLLLPLFNIVKKLKLQNYFSFLCKKFFSSKEINHSKIQELKTIQSNSLSTQIKELYYNSNIQINQFYSKTCDLVFRVEDVLFFAHKSILTFKSSIFVKCFMEDGGKQVLMNLLKFQHFLQILFKRFYILSTLVK